MTSSQTLLPPLYISLLSEVPFWESSAEIAPRSKIEFVFRNMEGFELLADRTLEGWNFQIYGAEDKSKKALEELTETLENESDSESSSESEEISKTQQKFHEFVIFVHQEGQDDRHPFFALSTSRAYKRIRNDCSMQFPRYCSRKLSYLIDRIQQISTGQVFGPIADASMILQQSFPETVSQNGLVCREFVATGPNFKVRFKENGVLIYRQFSLNQYIDILSDLTPEEEVSEVSPTFEWELPGIPDGNLIAVNQERQSQLHAYASNYITGLETEGWTFSFRMSERAYSNATKFRLLSERRRYGWFHGGGIETAEYDFSAEASPPDFNQVKEAIFQFSGGIDSIPAKRLTLGFVIERRLFLQYCTIHGQWLGQPVIDCIDGWVRSKDGEVFYKLGTLWYQINRNYVTLVQNAFQKVITMPDCLLAPGQSGYLSKVWGAEKENPYNRSYLELNPPAPSLPVWFDGNQKFRSNVELFDILHIGDEGQIFIYHVKKSFGKDIRVAASQLIISAQLIYNSRNTSYVHPDSLETRRYCENISPIQNDDGENRLFHALKTGNLHFVLAFKSGGAERMLNSASLIAEREIVRAKEEIEKLDYSFKISPIPSN